MLFRSLMSWKVPTVDLTIKNAISPCTSQTWCIYINKLTTPNFDILRIECSSYYSIIRLANQFLKINVNNSKEIVK